jgi:3-phosphoshikimate 1-carboxyvinyltransferase
MILNETYTVKKAAGHPIEASVPGSKSITNRALLIAALAEGESVLHGVLFSDDSRHFIQALIDLGFPVSADEKTNVVRITGFGGKIPAQSDTGESHDTIDVGSAGTAARFLTAYLGLCDCEGRKFRITSSEQMKKRPMQELLTALTELGAEISYEEEPYHFPFSIKNTGHAKHEVTIDVEKSSQFLSALLICSVLFTEDFDIKVKGEHGMAYVDMTVAMMEQFGVKVERLKEGIFKIPGNASYKAKDYRIEPDVSAASYFYAMCPILNVSAKVKHVHWQSLQGDTEFLHVLEKMGCESREDSDGIIMFPPKDSISGGSFDLSSFSDQALTLAAIACFAKEKVTIKGIAHIKYQECDRINAIKENLSAMGIRCEEPEEGKIIIYPGTPKACNIKTFEDHRVAMSFSLPGLVTEGIVIENPACCRKTFENYFEVLEATVCKPCSSSR